MSNKDSDTYNLLYELKANITIFMQTQQTESIKDLLQTTKIDLLKLVDESGYNIFHDLAVCIIKEDKLIEYLNIFIDAFKVKYIID